MHTVGIKALLHVQPASTTHVESQPSKATILPSSHYSVPSVNVSPHTLVQVLGVVGLPPVQTQPDTEPVQSDLHIEVPSTPPSSHVSGFIFRPSPQIAEQTE